MEQLFRQLYANIRFCVNDCQNLISPETASHTLAMCGTLANSTSILTQLLQQVQDLKKENARLRADLAKQLQKIEDAQNDGYDLEAQSILRHQHDIPWKEASDLLNAIKKTDQDLLPCALGDIAYVIVKNHYECHFCQYGKSAPIDTEERYNRKATGECNSTCPLSIKGLSVDSFQILLTRDGFQEIIPCHIYERAMFGNKRSVPIMGMDHRYYLNPEEARSVLKAYAAKTKATCI